MQVVRNTTTPGSLAQELAAEREKRNAAVAKAEARFAAKRDSVVEVAVGRMDAANAMIAELHTEINQLGAVVEDARN